MKLLQNYLFCAEWDVNP